MASAPFALILRHLRTAGRARPPRDTTDADLLRRFAAARDEAAFAELVRRHGPLVLGVCRRLLGDGPDAEDAFQATFLVLVRRAGAVRKHASVASFLHGVARRVALEARRRAARQRLHERQAAAGQPTAAVPDADHLDLRSALDGELRRLPEKYRAPLVLHYLEGKTKEETARALGWTEGTVSGRLARAREVLRGRLARGGLALTAGALAAALNGTARAAVPAPLAEATVRAASAFAAGATSGPASVLAASVLRGMLVTRFRIVALLVGLVLLAAGTGLLAGMGRNAGPAPDEPGPAAAGAPAGAGPRVDRFGDPLPPGAVLRLGTRRLRHADRVNGLAYSPDGRTILSGSGDHTARLWDVATGKELRRFPTPNEHPTEAFAVSRDGRLVAAGGQGYVWVWDVATGQQRLTLEAGGSGILYSLAFSPDGKTLAAGTGTEGSSGRVRLFAVDSGELVRTLPEPHKHDVRLAFAPDGSLLATSSDDGTIRLWHADTGVEERRLRGHAGTLESLAFSPDGQLLVSAGHDNSLRLWDVTAGKQRRALFQGDAPPKDQGYLCGKAVFSPDGKLIAWATSALDKEHFGTLLYLWDVATGKVVRHFNDSPEAVAFAPDGKTLATGGAGGEITLWETAKARQVTPLPLRVARPDDLAVSPDGRTLLGSEGEDVVVWDATTAKELRRWRAADERAYPFGLTEMVLLPDGRRLVTTGFGPTVRVWDVATGKLLRRFEGNAYVPVAFAPDGKYLLTTAAKEQTELQLWDVATGRIVRRFGSGDTAVFSPDDRLLALLSPDGIYEFWDVATGKRRDGCRLRASNEELERINTLVFAPDGRRVATAAYGDPGIRLWDLATGAELHRWPGTGALAFSPDGSTLAAAGEDHAIHLRNVATGREVGVLRGHEGAVPQVAFFHDGQRLLSRSDDGTALVWDLSAAGK